MPEITIPGEPRPKSRPRFTKNGGVYSDESQVAHEQLCQGYLRQAFPKPLRGGVGLGVTFFRSNRRRVDLDNLLKLILDSANRVAYGDDSQIVELAARIELDKERPRTVVLIEPRATSMPR